ncbi:uncharacterized protein LOC115231855 [Octopus sinensis]|uniref:Uncharacterized protein LOC115231855 n=1 Tax=Octopus sinensis TaxID=2607531 RepID=A0A6P7TYU4_9MOLL|nr:uncharacterized protein LOC115231855 [Octopus sinensis]
MDSHNQNASEYSIEPVMVRRQIVSNDVRESIINKSLDEYSTKDIAQLFNKKYQTVNSILKKFFKTGEVIPSKRGGDRRSKLTDEMKQELVEYVDEDCTKSLKDLSEWIFFKFNLKLSLSTVAKALNSFHYTLKRITLIPERRNSVSTIESRRQYATDFRNLEALHNDKALIFLDEVGFKVVTRPSRGRSKAGHSAYLSVSASRSRNISVVAAMNKYGMLFHKIHDKAVNGEDFKTVLLEIKALCLSKDITNPIFIMDNARIHHYRGLENDTEVSTIIRKFLPPYCPFLNPIENVFQYGKT